MLETWLVELLKGLGKFFLHPLFYYMMAYSIFLGYRRVKRERRDFHIRAQTGLYELRTLLFSGLIPGLIISVITVGAGIVLPMGSVVLIAAVALVLTLSFRMRWLSAVYVLGISFFAVLLLSKMESGKKWMTNFIEDFNDTSLPALAILLAIFLMAEGVMMFRNGSRDTSPRLLRSKRGQLIGAHNGERLWMLPVLMVLPGDVLSLPFDWWPYLTLGGEKFSLLAVPFFIGFQQHIQGSLPSESIRITGKRVTGLGILTAAIAVASIWYPPAAIVAAASAMIGRELISIQQRLSDDSHPFYFSRKEKGLMVIGIIPDSPAEKMALGVGEIITKVNGIQVKTEDDLYQALQRNRAYSKLEVVDTRGELRFVQTALYEGQHHELGILFVPREKKWEDEAAGAL